MFCRPGYRVIRESLWVPLKKDTRTSCRDDAIAWIHIFNLSAWNIPTEMSYYMKDHPELVEMIQSSATS